MRFSHVAPRTSLPRTSLVRTSWVRVSLAGAVAATTLAFTAPPATAANDWSTKLSHAGGKLQLCKVATGRTWTVRMRLDNRGSQHWHKAWAWQTGTHKEVTVTVPRGRISALRTLRGVPRGGRVGVQLGHTWGGELGHYGKPVSTIRLC